MTLKNNPVLPTGAAGPEPGRRGWLLLPALPCNGTSQPRQHGFTLLYFGLFCRTGVAPKSPCLGQHLQALQSSLYGPAEEGGCRGLMVQTGARGARKRVRSQLLWSGTHLLQMLGISA